MHSLSIEAPFQARDDYSEIGGALAVCRAALAEPGFQRIEVSLPAEARGSAFWFDLLSGYPYDAHKVARLKTLKGSVVESATPEYSLERFAVLQALLQTAPQWPSQSLPRSVISFCAVFCNEIAANEPQWAAMLDIDNEPERFMDVAKIATLRRFIAGEVAFSYERVPPARGLLSVHPLSLPLYLANLSLVMKGIQPVMSVHLNYGRKGSLILSREQFEQSLWRLAKTVEMQPRLKGLNTAAWFFSKVTGEVVPHMAWMRAMFEEGGAFLVDMQPHPASTRYSFTYNNKKRQMLYEAGKFCPRYTGVYWQRDDFMNWAASRPDLADARDEPIAARAITNPFKIRSPKSAPQTKRNSKLTLWDGIALSDRMGLMRYIGLVLVGPGAIAAGACIAAGRPLLAPLAFLLAFFCAHTFQYYLSQ